MPTPIADLRERIAAQRTDNPAMYGAVDFSVHPERLLLDGDIAASELRSYPRLRRGCSKTANLWSAWAPIP